MSSLRFHMIRGRITALSSTAESSVSLVSPVCTFYHGCESNAVLESRHSLNRFFFNNFKKLSYASRDCSVT